MSGIGTGFNNFHSSYAMFDDGIYKGFVDYYKKFTGDSQNFKIMLSKKGHELTKLKAKYAQTKSEKLAQIIQRKEQEMSMLNQTFDQARDGYFAAGEAIAQQVSAYLQITV